jgi:hypothetical protein
MTQPMKSIVRFEQEAICPPRPLILPPSLLGAWQVITALLFSSLRHNMQQTLQQIIDERISFLQEQISLYNKPEENRTFKLQIDAIRFAADNIEELEAIIWEKKALLKNTNDVFEFDRLSAELEGVEWLQRQISRLVWG